MTLDDALAEVPVVAIVRGVTPAEILPLAEALHDAGLRAVEIPLNSPEPLESLRRLAREWGGRMVVGAGTVLTPDAVDAVEAAGGRLIVAPNTDPAVIARALHHGLVPAPGMATATEAFAALAAGARHLKLFPAATYGPGHLKQLRAVLPRETPVWAVGGVGPANLELWREAGATAFGVGSDIYRPGQSAEVSHGKARAFVEAWRTLRRRYEPAPAPL